MLTAICKGGHTLLCHGGGYPRGKVNGPLWAEAVARTRIQVNIPQHQKWPATVSSRSYRVLACRGFLLSQASEDFNDLLTAGEHYVTFKDGKDGRAKGQYYLEHEDERNRIAEQGKRYVLANYLPVHMAERMLKMVYS